MKTEAEIGVIATSQGSPKHQKLEKSGKDSPHRFQREHGPANLGFGLGLQDYVALSHPVCGHLSPQPRDTSTLPSCQRTALCLSFSGPGPVCGQA